MSRLTLFVLALLLAATPSAFAEWKAAEVTGVVNLNTATQDELQKLPGIGPAKAQRILEARGKRKFESTDQIMRVKGIGRKTYRRLKPNLAIAGLTTIVKKPRSQATTARTTEPPAVDDLLPAPIPRLLPPKPAAAAPGASPSARLPAPPARPAAS